MPSNQTRKATKSNPSAANPQSAVNSGHTTTAASPNHTTMTSSASTAGVSLVVVLVAVILSQTLDLTSNSLVETLRDAIGVPSASFKCEDRHENCAFWASEGECAKNPEYMTRICVESCNLCNIPKTEIVSEGQESDDVEEEELDDEDSTGYEEDEENEIDDEIEGGNSPTPRIITDSEKDDNPDCVDSDPDCRMWADRGECEINPTYMLENCQKSCRSCKKSKSTNPDAEDVCEDVSHDCPTFAEQGECDRNPNWMLENCRKSCKTCGDEALVACNDHHKDCRFWSSLGECDANPDYMLKHCKKSCNVCSSDDEQNELADGSVKVKSTDSAVQCRDRHPEAECKERLMNGECESNPGWTIVFCAKTCGKCDLLPQNARCIPEVFNDTSYRYEDALKAKGDLNRIFETILRNYPTTEVLLRPPQGPWVLRFPDFVTEEERKTVLELTLPNLKRSTDQSDILSEDGIQTQVVSSGRTSLNAWCVDECEEHPIVQGLTERISKVVQVPAKNFESFQVLQYKNGQKYDTHHDSSDLDLADMSGPRILTFFIYFSDVEEGGETYFDQLGLKVKPAKGSAILWPSVMDEDPNKIDERTTHAALPVMKGEKLAANVWVHLRDFSTPNLWGCTGAFEE